MQMGVTCTKFCDFVVWSSKDTFTVRIPFDDHFWADLKAKLINFHHSYLCPEIFEMMIPRNLLPFNCNCIHCKLIYLLIN